MEFQSRGRRTLLARINPRIGVINSLNFFISKILYSIKRRYQNTLDAFSTSNFAVEYMFKTERKDVLFGVKKSDMLCM